MRFSTAEEALLLEAAGRVGLAPTALMRALTLNGCAAMLRDERG